MHGKASSHKFSIYGKDSMQVSK